MDYRNVETGPFGIDAGSPCYRAVQFGYDSFTVALTAVIAVTSAGLPWLALLLLLRLT